MRELNAEFLVLRVQEVGYAADGGDLRIGPETGVFRGNAAVGEDGGGFDDGEGGAAVGEGGEVDEVEVGEVAVGGGVGAHWGDPWVC